MLANSDKISRFINKISSLDEEKKDRFNSILETRYLNGFPNKVVGRRFKYKYTEDIKKDDLPFLDEFNYYYYEEYTPSEELLNIINKLSDLKELIKTVDENTFTTPAKFCVSIFKIGNIKSKIYDELEMQIIKEKSEMLEKSLHNLLKDILDKDVINKTLSKEKTFSVFDTLYDDVNINIPGFFMPSVNLKAKTFIRLVKWMVLADEIMYLEEIEEKYNIDNDMNKIFEMYENKFIENDVNLLEEYTLMLDDISNVFIQICEREKIPEKEAIDKIVNALQVSDEEKYMIEDYLWDTSKIEGTMKRMIDTINQLEHMITNKYL